MIANIPVDRVLFLDIETVSGHPNYEELSEHLQPLWKQKGGRFARTEGVEWTDAVAARLYREKAAIFAEFGKIVVISAGVMYRSEDGMALKIKSFASQDEKSLLMEFASLLDKHYSEPKTNYICGHNIREFDIPYLCRRMIIHGMELPGILDVTGKKPWETEHFLDTMSLWKFGDFKNYTSLNLLAHLLNVPTPKDDIDGSEVGRVYWTEQDLPRIAKYCEKDVATVAQLVLRFQRQPLIPEERIFSVTE